MAGIRLSRFYNDPSIGKGFENLAGAFAPPEATDLLAGQKALELRDKGARLAELYANPSDPSYDRRATLLGLQTGSQSLEAVGLNNATTRATNAADNARALATNANTTRGTTISSLYGPLSPGQVRPAVPDSIAGTIGLPRIVEARGAEPAETEATLKAKILGGLPAAEQRAAVLGAVPTENVATPQGPRIAFRPDAIGQQPAPAAVAPSNVSRLQAERAALPAGDPRIGELDSAIAAEGRGAVADPYRSATDQALASRHAEIVKAGATADTMSTNLDRLEGLLQAVPTGALAERKLQVARYAQDLGLGDVATSLTGGKLDEAQAANAIVQRLAPGLRVPGSGAQSDRELTNFLASLPSLQNTPGGNRIILGTLRQAAQQQRQAAEIARQAQAGTLDKFEADRRIAALASPFARFADAGGSVPPASAGVGSAAPPASGPAPVASNAQPVRVSSPAEARRLPSGTPILLPDGSTGRVP